MRKVLVLGFATAMLAMLFTASASAADTREVISTGVSPCAGSPGDGDQVCDPRLDYARETTDYFGARFTSAGGCANFHIHFFVDGVEVFRGEVGPAGSNTGNRRNFFVPAPRGVHRFGIKATGFVNGCNTGRLGSWGGTLELWYNPDFDNDGVAESRDACPDTPRGTVDGNGDGCPDNSDGDSVWDQYDACPGVHHGGFDTSPHDGCPDNRDGDSVIDEADACPTVHHGAFDSSPRDGCPDNRDGDGRLDTDDACPTVHQGTIDVNPADGCPDDRDRDTIPDTADACDDLPRGGIDRNNDGCPDDSDGDTVADDRDACPSSHRGNVDRNGDGCADDTDGDGLIDDRDSCPGESTRGFDPNNNGCYGPVPRIDGSARGQVLASGGVGRIDWLRVSKLMRGARVQLRCVRGCSARESVASTRGSTFSSKRLVGKSVRAGAIIDIRVTKPQTIGYFVRLTVKARALGFRYHEQCLPVGSTSPRPCNQINFGS